MKLTELIDFENCTYNWNNIESIPEFAVLKECQQNPKWHGEGNAFIHTQHVCMKAIEFVNNRELYDHFTIHGDFFKKCLLTAALFHDIGKGTTTFEKNGVWHSYGHELESERITRRLLWDEDLELREGVCALVKHHMKPLHILDSKNPYDTIIAIKMSLPCNCWSLLIDLKMCDLSGSQQVDEDSKSADWATLFDLENIVSHFKWDWFPVGGRFNSVRNRNGLTKKTIWVNVMIGLPGSGKDTYIANYKNHYNAVVVCRDDIRVKLGYCTEDEKIVGTPEQEAAVTAEFNRQILDAANGEDNIVIWINNINLKKKYRDGYKNLLKDYNVFWNYIYVEAKGLGTNIERRKGQIDEKVFYNMINSFDYPTPEEYDNLQIYYK